MEGLVPFIITRNITPLTKVIFNKDTIITYFSESWGIEDKILVETRLNYLIKCYSHLFDDSIKHKI